MSFSVTGCIRLPDVGFAAATCGTADTAYARAVDFLASGLRSVEVRDPDGRIYVIETLHLLQASLDQPGSQGPAWRNLRSG